MVSRTKDKERLSRSGARQAGAINGETTDRPDFSIILPTRERPALATRLLESIHMCSEKREALEIILYLDGDDLSASAIGNPGLSLVRLTGTPGRPLGEIMGECYQKSRGRYIMLMNDDAVFRTPGWDRAVRRAFASFEDGVALVYGNDLDQKKRVPTFPILSRTACELMGGICPAGYFNLHIESHLLDIFRHLKAFGHERVIYLEEVVFEHMHFLLGKGKKDALYHKKNVQRDDRLFIVLGDERVYRARLMAAYIEACRKKETNFPSAPPAAPSPLLSIVEKEPHPGSRAPAWLTGLQGSGGLHWELLSPRGDMENKFSATGAPGGNIKLINGGQGPAWANHCALKAQGEFLIFLDGWATPKPGWAAALVKALQKNENAALAGCKLLDPRNGRVKHAGIAFYREGDALRATFLYRGLPADHPAVNKPREVQAVSGVCLAVRRDVFLEAGGFTEAGLAGDIELCLRIRQMGKTALYVPRVEIIYPGECGRWATQYPEAASHPLREDLQHILEQDGFTLRKKKEIFLVEEGPLDYKLIKAPRLLTH